VNGLKTCIFKMAGGDVCGRPGRGSERAEKPQAPGARAIRCIHRSAPQYDAR
jgi:hypothetical protein